MDRWNQRTQLYFRSSSSFFLGTFPATYYGAEAESKLFGIDTFFYGNPLGIFLNGNFFVFIFIFLTKKLISWRHDTE